MVVNLINRSGIRAAFGVAVFALSVTSCDNNSLKDVRDSRRAARLGQVGSADGAVPVVPSRNYSSKELIQASALAAKTLLNRTGDFDREMVPAGAGYDSYRSIVAKLVSDPANLERFRSRMMEEHRRYLKIGGANPSTTVDFDMPARMGTYLILNDLDYRELLTSKVCVSKSTWQPEPCEAFRDNPAAADRHAAGVLSTRAFLSMHKNGSGFNFRPVREAFAKFACAEYPDVKDPGTPRDQVGNSVHPWGNNPACYSCHKSMNAKALPFYNFKNDGFFTDQVGASTRREDNTISNPADLFEPGADPRVFGKPIRTLADLGQVYVQDRRFAECMTRRYVNFAFGRAYSSPLPPELDYVVNGFINSGYRVKTLLQTIVSSPMFVEQGVLAGVP
jgi:hypothetical protein